jgi:M6 family metalloprotease-like protein
MYGSSFPRLDHFWQELSYSTLNVGGSTSVSKWYSLPQPHSYYVYDMTGDGRADLNFERITNDCVGVADSVVDFRDFNGINLMFNGELDGSSWGGSSTLTLDGLTKSWMMTWEPVWGYTNLAVLEHEMGHGFGLVHSTAPNGEVYKNEWDLMSDTGSNCSNSTDPVFGCLGQHIIAYYKDSQDWVPPSKVIKVNSGELKTITLERLALPQSAEKLVIYVPKGDSTSKFFSIEARKKIGYDVKLPGEGVIIHDVDTGRMNQAEVIDIDHNGDVGDDGAIWLPGETYEYVTLEMRIWISIRSVTSNGYVVMVSNDSGEEIPPMPTPEPTPTPGPRNNLLYLPYMNTDSSP